MYTRIYGEIMKQILNDKDGIVQEQELLAWEEFKLLQADELLNIWEQTQTVEMEMRTQLGSHIVLAPNYEKIILLELHSRILNNSLVISPPKTEKKVQKPRIKRKRMHLCRTRG